MRFALNKFLCLILGNNQTVVSHLISQPLSIHAHHPSLQPITENPCQNQPCQHICLLSPSSMTGYTCKCMAGFRATTDGRCIEEDVQFLMVMRGSQIIDVPLNTGDKSSGYLTPIVGIDNGLQVDFDRKTGTVYWVEGKEDEEENVSFAHTERLVHF